MSALPGIAIPVSFVVTGSGGISSMQPGNGTGQRPRRADRRGAPSTIVVGSGANDAVGPIIPLVTRNTIANDAANAAPRHRSCVGGPVRRLAPRARSTGAPAGVRLGRRLDGGVRPTLRAEYG